MVFLYKQLTLIVVSFLVIAYPQTLHSQSELKLKSPIIYYTSVYSIGVFATGYLYHNNIKGLSAQDVAGISSSQLSKFNRAATYNNSKTADIASDIVTIGAMAMPSAYSLQWGWSEKFLSYNTVYAQTLASTVGQVLLLKAITKKERPFVYNTVVGIDEKLQPDARLSFPSGHTAITAAACYFFATTYSFYNKDNTHKKWVWLGAALIPAVSGLLRYEAGKHFFADVATGYAIGALNGVIFPLMFRKKI